MIVSPFSEFVTWLKVTCGLDDGPGVGDQQRVCDGSENCTMFVVGDWAQIPEILICGRVSLGA